MKMVVRGIRNIQSEPDDKFRCNIASLVLLYDLFQVRTYVEQSEHQLPLVVTGGPCSGKAVLVAHCGQQVHGWQPFFMSCKIKQ